MFRLLGAKDLGVSDNYMKEKMPAVNVGLLDGQLAWRQHDGGHTDGPNWTHKDGIIWAMVIGHLVGGGETGPGDGISSMTK